MVRDPQFWKRFSVAVHQDDQLKEEMTKYPDVKHSYVTTTSLSSPHSLMGSPPTSPTQLPSGSSQPPAMFSPLSIYAQPLDLSFTSTLPSFVPLQPQPQPQPQEPSNPVSPPKPHCPRSKLQKSPSTRPLLRPTISFPQEEAEEAIEPSPPHPPPKSPTPPPQSPFFRTPNLSTLSLSGRPPSRFKYWTTITANAPMSPCRPDSWLESQQRKARHRTWICWAFWIAVLLLVAGIVVTVLVLRAHGII